MKKFYQTHRDTLLLILRCAVTLALFVTAVANYRRLTNIDMRALVEGSANVWIAVAVIIGVFAIKSVLFIIPASMIYISVGMAFSPFSAIMINLAGIALEVTITYLLGYFLGGEYVEKRLKKTPAGQKVLSVQDNKKLSALLLVRALPVFPIDFVSLLLGAAKLPFLKYFLISVVGIMPRVILFTILGDTIYDYIPMNLIVLIIVSLIPVLVIYWIIKHILKKRKESAFSLELSAPEHEKEAADFLSELEKTEYHAVWLEYSKLFESADSESEEYIPSETRFFIRKKDAKIVGMINLRFAAEDDIGESGHISFVVRPSERRKGYASAMLARSLDIYRQKGFERVTLICDKDNTAGAGVIAKNKGVLCKDFESGSLSKYYIEL